MKSINTRITIVSALAICYSILCSNGGAYAAPQTGCVSGRIVDAGNDEPVNWAGVIIEELKRSEPSHENGRFSFCMLPMGSYTLVIEHIGYRTVRISFQVGAHDTTELEIRLQPSALQTEEVVVTATRDRMGLSGVGSVQTLSGANLQQHLGRTLAETIADEAGVAQASMGPATARPVVRGLGGDRLVILEEGMQTGDASARSTDHAVTADPMAAEKIEILRGPASFIYSSNALGGIINVEREKTVANRPDRIHGTGSVQAESVNWGYAAGASLAIPAGPLGLQLHGSYRSAGDISTPEGELENTDIETFDGSMATSWIFDHGSIGASAGYYRTGYGIPGGFVGTHPEGVRIDMNRTQYTGTFAYYIDSSFLKRIRADLGFVRYYHGELESDGHVGTEFGILTTSAALRFFHDSIGRAIDRGIVSIQGEMVNLAANGLRIPETDQRSIAATLLEEKRVDRLSISGAIRFDLRETAPQRLDSSEVGHVRPRTFSGLSGSIMAAYALTGAISIEGGAMRTFRGPTVEELFSEGPHLASYSYEIGNADLNAETGLSLEGSLRYVRAAGHARLTLFRNAIDGYIFPAATGDTNFRTLLPIYQHRGEKATLSGLETEFEWELPLGFVAGGTLSYVLGERVDLSLPLPSIPPLNGNLALRWSDGTWFAGVTARLSAAQNRVGQFEAPTSGYTLFDAFVQYRIATERWLHTIVLNVENAFDATYRYHLSRTKAFMPEPGRNIRLLYRIYF